MYSRSLQILPLKAVLYTNFKGIEWGFQMKITKIERQKKDKQRYSIYADEEFLVGVHEQVLLDFSLFTDKELTPELVQQIKSQEFESKVYQKALNYISYQLRSVKEVQDYLTKLELTDPSHPDKKIIIAPATREKTIDKLIGQGYLNDQIYGESYARNQANINYKGPRNIEQELIKKGLSETEIHNALDEYSPEQQLENALELARKFIRKQKRLTPKMIENKLQQHLITKGYNRDIVQQAISRSDTHKDDEEIDALLENDAAKSLRKRRRKYSGYDLKQYITQDLIGKGYTFDKINFWLEDHEHELEEEDI